MKLKLAGIFLLGLLIGWATVPFLQAEDTDFKSYKQALRVMISLIQDLKKTSQQTADDTRALRKKLVGDVQ